MTYEQRAWQLVWLLLQLLFFAAVVTGLYNVFADSREVEQMAMTTACEGQGPSCRAQMTRGERWPIGQTYEMITSKGSQIVKCHREYYFVGDYRCAVREIPSLDSSIPAASATPSAPASAKPARSQPNVRK